MAESGGFQPVQLREFIEAIMDERDRRYEQRFKGQTEAIIKAENATEKRFEGVNEFRAQLTDQAATFLRREEYSSAHQALIEKMEDKFAGVEVKLETLNALIGAAMPRGEAEQRLKDVSKKLDELDRSDRLRTGRSAGFETTRVTVFAVVGALLTFMSLALAIYANTHR